MERLGRLSHRTVIVSAALILAGAAHLCVPGSAARAAGDLLPEVCEPVSPFSSPPLASRPHAAGLEAEIATTAPGISGSLTATPPPNRSFAGIAFTGLRPANAVGDVGPNHYVQMANAVFAIFNRAGALLAGPAAINSLWAGVGGACETRNDGSPMALYDPLADRWLLSQVASVSPAHLCLAVSKTGDPVTGGFWLYDFTLPAFPDFPNFAVWPDGYYLSTNGAGVYAFHRAAMLAGGPASYVRFTPAGNVMMPGDLDGAPPPAGSPNYFFTFQDKESHAVSEDRLELYAFHVDWVTPANSTFTGPTTIPLAPFNYTVCGYFNFNCVPQPGTAQKLDAVSEWPMFRLAYRNFGSHEALVGNFTVDADGLDHAGIRWFELRRSGAGPWALHQEGTHAPDADHRFAGSIAMDRDGAIALGYTASGSSLYPSLRYVVHEPADPPGTLQAEATLSAGAGSQTTSNRWGNISALSVDPTDDCTFWYTGQYLASPSNTWSTRIGSFVLPACGEKVTAPAVSGPSTGKTGVWLTFTLSGAASTQGYAVEHQFDWGDGTRSGWLPPGTTRAKKSWATPGRRLVKARARSSAHPEVVSVWSAPRLVEVYFFDDFSDGRAAGDPDWREAAGNWSVNATKNFASDPRRNSLALVRRMSVGAARLTAGRIQARVRLTSRTANRNASILFAYQGATRHRFVRLLPGRVEIGQVGTFGGNRTFVARSRVRTYPKVGTWEAPRVDILPDGRVKVYLRGRLAVAYRFAAAVPGGVGCAARRAASFFDNYTVWDRTIF